MASTANSYARPVNTSQRSVAMALALITAIVLSPLYLTRRKHEEPRYYETRILTSSGFVLPMVVAGLVIAIKTASSSSSSPSRFAMDPLPQPDPTSVLRIGSSSWGLAGILMMLLLVISWQDSAQGFLWR